MTLIDTGGINPFDPEEMKSLSKTLSLQPMDKALILPAGMDTEESAEIARSFQILGIQKLVPTRLDFARRLGGILNAAHKGQLTLTEASHTPEVANGFIRLSAERLSDYLLPPKKGKGGKS